jgi:hypothetical protein
MVKKIWHEENSFSYSNSVVTDPSNQTTIGDAIALHREGMLSEAQAIYRHLI